MGSGPQVTLRVLWGCGVEVAGAGGVLSGSGCIVMLVDDGEVGVVLGWGRMGPVRVGLEVEEWLRYTGL